MEKNNRLIAEFMGYTLNENDEYPIEYITVQGHWDTCSIQDLNYHKSWDWLMKVVEKIYQTDLYYDKYIDFNSSMFSNGKIELSTNKESVYNDCIDFINFYNKEKEK